MMIEVYQRNSNDRNKEHIMFRKLFPILALLIGVLLLQCSEKSVSPDNPTLRELTSAEKTLVESDNRFGLKLFREMVAEEKDSNIFISPLSVSMALGMTYNGANGETQTAMQNALELSGLSIQEVNESYKSLIELLTGLDPKVRFDIANSIWYRHTWTFEQEFLDLCGKYFDALVTGLDFDGPDAAKTINAWVEQNTNGKIKEIVNDPISGAYVMFLINAIYFKGNWTYKFDKDLTQDDEFQLSDGTKKPCKMMVQEGDFQHFSNYAFQAIDLAYGDGKFSMTIILPHPEADIDSLVGEISPENWELWINSFSEQTLILMFPRFKLECEYGLNQALKALGMEIAFDPRADFTRMFRPGGIWIDTVKHKTFVKVDEEGTEAAAVTSVGMRNVSLPPTMRVDRPFVFAIRENHSQTILFIGKVLDPTFE
jgi:serpin B